MSLLHPCEDCIVKMVCREICGKTVQSPLIHDTMMYLERCVDCGCKIGISNILFNDTLRCKECMSMYYLTSYPPSRINRKYKVHIFGAMEHYVERTFSNYVEKIKLRIGDFNNEY
jgi:hypothetical protein